MEARADADGVRRERLPLRRERDPAGKDHGGGSGPPLLHVRRPDPGGGDGDDTEWSNKRYTFFSTDRVKFYGSIKFGRN